MIINVTRLGRRTVRRRSLGLCTKCGKVPPAPNKERCENCSNLEIIRLRNERKRLRKEVISHYSPDRKCTCCGESNIEFLTIARIPAVTVTKWSETRREEMTYAEEQLLRNAKAAYLNQIQALIELPTLIPMSEEQRETVTMERDRIALNSPNGDARTFQAELFSQVDQPY